MCGFPLSPPAKATITPADAKRARHALASLHRWRPGRTGSGRGASRKVIAGTLDPPPPWRGSWRSAGGYAGNASMPAPATPGPLAGQLALLAAHAAGRDRGLGCTRAFTPHRRPPRWRSGRMMSPGGAPRSRSRHTSGRPQPAWSRTTEPREELRVCTPFLPHLERTRFLSAPRRMLGA